MDHSRHSGFTSGLTTRPLSMFSRVIRRFARNALLGGSRRGPFPHRRNPVFGGFRRSRYYGRSRGYY